MLGKSKIKRLDVVCPGFSSDCLETLEEIAMEGKVIFQSNGGGEYHYIPALNESDGWVHAMAEIAMENLGGWVSTEWDKHASELSAQNTASLAKALGAKQ
jgi:ferrochelatase